VPSRPGKQIAGPAFQWRTTLTKIDLCYCKEWAGALAASGLYDGADAAALLPRIAIGTALGIDPATAAGNISVSRGKVTIAASLQAALLIRRGEVRYDLTDADEERVALFWYRKGKALGRSQFTMAEAKRAGLTSKSVCVRRDPFVLLVAEVSGCGFTRCDRLYVSLGLNPGRLKRQALAAWHAIKQRDGDTWHGLGDAVRAVESQIGGANPNPRRALALMARARWLAFRLDAAGNHWLA
jgi:hypothetical protein